MFQKSPDADAPPPAYELVQRSEQISDRIENEVETRKYNMSEACLETVRLCNFISFCLETDYQAYLDSPCSYTLSSTDRDHYLDLYEATLAVRKARGTDRNHDRVLEPYLRKHLHEPSASLGIPSKCVELIVLRFALNLNYARRYKGCVPAIRINPGMRTLAKKLWTDRQVIIPRLFMPESTRRNLNEALLWMARVWFVSIDGSDSTLSVLTGLETTSREEAMFKYTLSRSGQDSHDNPKGPQFPGRRVLAVALVGTIRLLRLKPRPRSRLPIFPENAKEGIFDPASLEPRRTQATTVVEEPCETQAPAPRRLQGSSHMLI